MRAAPPEHGEAEVEHDRGRQQADRRFQALGPGGGHGHRPSHLRHELRIDVAVGFHVADDEDERRSDVPRHHRGSSEQASFQAAGPWL